MLNLIKNYKSFAIYGAQVVAYGAYKAIRNLLGRLPECFVVSSTDGNPDEIDGIPVRILDTVSKDALIIIAVTELLQDEIVKVLHSQGYEHMFKLVQHEEHLLMSQYFAAMHRFPALDSPAPGSSMLDSTPLRDTARFMIYEVRSEQDKPLANPPRLSAYECPIQAGAALASKRIARVSDDSGCNISVKNRQYCEMSAAYWVWKNTSHEWVGIEHYRRHLLVAPECLSKDIDAVLPLPYMAYPDITAQFGRFVSKAVYHALLAALQALYPGQYENYLRILSGSYQYTYNLVCARREVFNDYCRWFFRITEYMEGLVGQAPEIASTRALSYVAEVLTNLYFMSNQSTLRIRHAEKAIYV